MKTYRHLALSAALLACAVAPALADQQNTASTTGKVRDAVLTTAVVKAAMQAGSSFGLQGALTIEVLDGISLARQYDINALTAEELSALDQSAAQATHFQPKYVVVKDVRGAGCIAAPKWHAINPGDKDKPIGLTNMRCASSGAGFARLMKVALVTMAI